MKVLSKEIDRYDEFAIRNLIAEEAIVYLYILFVFFVDFFVFLFFFTLLVIFLVLQLARYNARDC